MYSAIRRGMPPNAQDVHREERAVEEDERQEEMDVSQGRVHHPAEHLGIPEVIAPKMPNIVPPNST